MLIKRLVGEYLRGKRQVFERCKAVILDITRKV